MIFSIKNIGKILSAQVELNGITVIAGENNTGKSTVGKSLFTLFNSFYDVEKNILKERERSIENALFVLRGPNLFFSPGNAYEHLLSELSLCTKNADVVEQNIKNTLVKYGISEGNEKFDAAVKKIVEIFGISDKEIIKNVLQRRMDVEFNDQMSNVYSDNDGLISLCIKGSSINVLIRDNKIINVDNSLKLDIEAIYLDDPFVLDEVNSVFSRHIGISNHRNHLIEKLSVDKNENNIIDEIISNGKLEQIYSMISGVCDGEVIKGKRNSLTYKLKGTEKSLDVKNLSTGLKAFVILKRLLLNGSIKYNGTVILDEPEIHLHPEWQLLFAELIVLLHREFGLHILLNTHSPYFLNAIEVYSNKYGVQEKCKYYLAENIEENAVISDVTDDLERIYIKLARPLQILENESASDV